MILSHSKHYLSPAILLLAILSTNPVMAEPTAATAGTSISPSPATASVPESKLVSSFAPLAGSTENSTSLVKGLRSGTPIVLTSPSSTPGAPSNTVTFTSPTRPMGYGNIRIALSLAKTQLASQGITQPTPEQLQGALMGTSTTTAGTTTTQQGILQMRASGMGWGQIANSMGVKLGAVMSGKTPAVATTTTTSTSGAVNATGAKSNSTSGGGTTAAGNQGKHSGTTTAEGAKPSGGSKGITTSMGHNSSSKGITTSLGHNSSSKGITTSQGHSSNAGASSGAVNAAGSRAGGIGSAAGANTGHGSGGKKP